MESEVIQAEPSIFDSFETDEAAEYLSLVRSLQRAKHFTLLFARCNQRPRQKELIEKIKSDLPNKKIEVVYFEDKISNLLEELRKKLNEKPDAIFIYGLENSMPNSQTADKTPFVLNLNASRNSFPQVADCSVVFWLPDYGITAIMNGASDFFSIRSGVFFFESDLDLMSQQISQATEISGIREIDALHLEERIQRLSILEELLAEYQSLPNEKRDLGKEMSLIQNLAALYYVTANFSKAEKVLKQALEVAENIVGKYHPDYVTLLNNLAGVYTSQGKYDEAIKLLNQALKTAENIVGLENLSYASLLSGLARVYNSQGKYDEAIKLLNQALKIAEKSVGKKHPNYASHLSTLAIAYHLQGKYDEAIELFKQALKIDENTIGNEHPYYATDLSNLASVYNSQGRYDEAIELFKQALKIDENTIGNEHPNYATQLNNLALVYDSKGRYDEAIELFNQASVIYKNSLPEVHPFIQTVKENLKLCQMKLKKK